MKVMNHLSIIFLIIMFEVFSSQFSNPAITPMGTTSPTLSFPFSAEPQIVSDNSGQYLYAIWMKEAGIDDKIVQVAISFDYGISWNSPSSTLWGSPNLSDPNPPGGQSTNNQITTNSTGQYVYATWTRDDGVDLITQVGISSNFGNTWENPTSTPTDPFNPNPNISTTNAKVPQITTDGTGQYVYTIWVAEDGFASNIQTTISSDFGKTWVFPNSTPIDPLNPNPNLSFVTDQSFTPQITTDKSGKYVYAIWIRHDLDITGKFIVQTAKSSDFGKTWVYPSSTPVDPLNSNPNLSSSDHNSFVPHIVTDDTGKHVYAIWDHDNGGNLTIQIAISSDFGNTWTNPSSTLYGVPNLSDPSHYAINPQIAANSNGKNVYVIWSGNNGSHDIIQIAISSNYGFSWQNPMSTPLGSVPNLSDTNYNSNLPQVTASLDGKYVFATWQLSLDPEKVIQIANSSDYGKTWRYPISTLPGINTPNLTFSTDISISSKIASSSSGQYINIIWQTNHTDIQTCRGVMGMGFFPTILYPIKD